MNISRTLMCCLVALCLAASPGLAHDDGGSNETEDNRLVVLNGGGWGHSVGMSQYGAYGRALAGHTYDQILSFYYHDTTLAPVTDFKMFDPDRVPESIEVEVGVQELIAISTPLDELEPGAWELSVEVAGEVIGTSTLPLTTYYDGTRWHATYTDKSTATTTDLCEAEPRCENTVLEVAQTIGRRAVVEEYEDGPNLGAYYGGRYFLHPATVAVDGNTRTDCGSGIQFCVEHSGTEPTEHHSLNVLVDLREKIAISTPLDELAHGAWELTVEVAGEVIGTSTLPLTTYYDGTRWHATYTEKDTQTTTDLCAAEPRCENTALEVVQTVGIRAVIEEFEDGPNLGSYAGARYLLHPATVQRAGSTPERCGSGRQFCVVVAELDFERYLYGLQEVPTDWPIEALKSQAVAARSYAAATVANRATDSSWFDEPFNLFDSVSDQVFTGWARQSGCTRHSWCEAVDATAAEVVVYEVEPVEQPDQDNQQSTDQVQESTESGEQDTTTPERRIARTFYSSSNGGHTSKPSDVWSGVVDLPFLVPKPDPYDAAPDPETGNPLNPYATWSHSYSVSDLTRWLNNYTVSGEKPLNLGTLTGIDIADVPKSGRTVFAKITLHDAQKSVTLTRDGKPYGKWLFDAIHRGCQSTPRCRPPRGTNFRLVWPDPQEPPLEQPDPDPGPDEPDPDPNEEQPAPVPDEPAPIIDFSDVSRSDYFYEPVRWATSSWIVQGTTAETLGPHDEITRAEFAEILWRFEGSPPPSVRAGFEDVPDDAPYRDAIDLLAEYQVTTGTSPTTFSPEKTLTRAQASTFLWRFAGEPQAVVENTFSDVQEGSYYSEAVRWMLEHEITTGTSPTTFSPDASLTRAQVITFLWRLAGLPNAFAPRLRSILPTHMRSSPNT